MTRPTIDDVAREAGVGIGTVSRVLGNSSRVAEATRQRVLAAIKRLGYRPSTSARALARGRTQTVEVIVPLLTRSYYVEVVRGVLSALADTEYLPNIRVLEQPADGERAAEVVAGAAGVDRWGQPDGLLFVRVTPSDDTTARLARAGVPAVLVDAAHSDLPSVGVDHHAAAAAMVAHLLSLGHRRIALVDRFDDPYDGAVLRARRQGYRDALAHAGIPSYAGYEPVAEWSAEGGASALDALLALPERPTAVFVGGDTIAIGVLDRARQRGLAVPGDLAVCGYGDIELARYLGLTTVHVPMSAMGEQSARLLLDAINGRISPTGHTTLDADLVVRSTCGAPPRPAPMTHDPSG